MGRLFIAVLSLDVAALVAPTRWMGYRLEIAVALLLAVVTALLWILIRVRQDEP